MDPRVQQCNGKELELSWIGAEMGSVCKQQLAEDGNLQAFDHRLVGLVVVGRGRRGRRKSTDASGRWCRSIGARQV